MPEIDEETLIVTLSGSHAVGEVTTSLAARGFKVGSVLQEIGVVTGTASAGAVEALRTVPGVADVSKDHEVSTM